MNYGKQRAGLVECKLHSEFHPEDEACRWCAPEHHEPVKTTWEDMVLECGLYCSYCRTTTSPLSNGDCSVCWGKYNP